MCGPEDVSSTSPSSPSASSTTPSTMAPKKKRASSAHPSTSKALPPVASNAAGGVEQREDTDAVGDVVGAGGTATTSPVADVGARGTGGEQHQEHLDGHALLANGHRHSHGTRSGANRHPPTAPITGTTIARALSPRRVDQAAASNGATGPRAPSPHHPVIQVVAPQQRGHGTSAAGSTRSRATARSTSSSYMPSTASDAMAWAQPLLRFPLVAEQMDEWCATIQSLLG